MVVRTGKRLGRGPQYQSVVLFDQYSETDRSQVFEVTDTPIVISAFGLQAGETIVVYTALQSPLGDIEHPFVIDGSGIVLSTSANSARLSVSGRYVAVFFGALHADMVCVYKFQVAGTQERIDQPSGVQANLPNLFFKDGGVTNTSHVIEIHETAWLFSAYGLLPGESISVLASYGLGAAEELAPYLLGGIPKLLTPGSNATVLDKSGRYRFQLIGDPSHVVLVGNQTILQPDAAGGGGGGQHTVTAGTGISVDNTDPFVSIVSLNSSSQIAIALANTALQPGNNVSLLLNDVGYVTASILTPNILAGDVTHAPVGDAVFNALATKQPLDADLTALAGVATVGMLVRTGVGTATTRTLQGLQSVVVTNGDGVLGNPSFALVGDVTTPSGLMGYAMSPVSGKGWYFPALFESTGVLSGFALTINAGNPALFDVAPGIAGFVDYSVSVVNPPRTVLPYLGSTGNTVTNIATQNVTYIGINAAGVIQQSSIPFSNSLRRSVAQIGVLVHSNLVNLNAINDTTASIRSGINQLYDLMAAIGPMSLEGNVITPNGANLSVDKTAGIIFKLGANFQINPLDPHNVILAALTAPGNIRYRMSNGTETANTSVLLPTQIESPLGTLVLMSNPNKVQVQRVNVFTSNLIRIQYGQQEYGTMEDAERAIATQQFTVEQNIKENGVPIAYIILKRSVTNLQTADAKIIPIGKFGSVGSGGAAITAATIITALGYTPEVAGAAAALLTSSVTNGDTTHAPTSDAVFDALALKEDKFDFSSTVFISDSLGKYFGTVWDKVETKLQTTATAKAIMFGGALGVYPGNPLPTLTGLGLADAIATGSWATPTAEAATSGDADVIAAIAALSAVNWATVKRLVIWMGTNDPDFGFGGAFQVPLGTTTDTTGATFRGAVNHIADAIGTAHPHIRVSFITPGFRENADTATVLGLKQVDYVDALVERSLANKIPVLDLYRLAGINQYNWPEFLSDGLHNSADGGDLLADKIAGWMRDQSSSAAHSVLTTAITNGDNTHAPDGNAVFDALALKANDADVVHDTGNETVAGVKTFSGNLTLGSAAALTKSGSFTGSQRTAISLTNTSTAFDSTINIAGTAGSGAVSQLIFNAPEYTAVASWTGRVALEGADAGGLVLSAVNATGNIIFQTGARVTRATITSAGAFNIATAAQGLQVAGTKVIGARVTGWAAATGTATRTTFATTTVTLPQLAERVKALIDDLIAHGVIGA